VIADMRRTGGRRPPLVKQALEAFGRIDILVANHGVHQLRGTVEELHRRDVGFSLWTATSTGVFKIMAPP